MKKCGKCKKVKELTEFFKDKSKIDGFEGRCKTCSKELRDSRKDGYHHVYYLPNHNYVGTSDNLYYRMARHKSVYKRVVDNYQILASFEDRGKAKRFESLMHDSGFEGRHSKNSYK
jgi:hypothetical protein